MPARPLPIALSDTIMLRLFVTCTLLALATAPAMASSFAGTTAGSAAGGASASSGATSGSTSGNDKVVLQAREDAAGFVASEGRIRGVYLEAALRHLRERSDDPQVLQASDMALAKAILAL